MLTEKETEKAINQLTSYLKDKKLDVLYRIKVGDNTLLENVTKVVFRIDKLVNAMFPHLEVECLNDKNETVYRFGFTLDDYYPNKLVSGQKFGPDLVYDIKDFKIFMADNVFEIDKDFYLSQKKYLEEALSNVNKIIEENNLKE